MEKEESFSNKEQALLRDYYEIAKKLANYSEENDFAFSISTTYNSQMLIDEETNEETNQAKWIHCGGTSKWTPFVCKYSAWAKTTSDRAGNDRVNVREIRVQMYGYWEDGNKTEERKRENASFVQTPEKIQDDFPWYCDRHDLSIDGYSKGPKGHVRTVIRN